MIKRVFSIVFIFGILFQSVFLYAREDDVFKIDRKKETILLGGGVLLFSVGTYLICHMDPVDSDALNRDHIFYPDRFAVDYSYQNTAFFSDITCGVCVGLPMISLFISKNRTAFYQDMVMYFESMLYIQGITFLSKAIIKRPRPYAYQSVDASGKVLDVIATQSFFSGHSSVAFNGAVFAATVFQRRNPRSSLIKPIWILGLSSALATGIFRVTSGNHFPSDVLAGALMGAFTGWIIPHLHVLDHQNKLSVPVTGNRIGVCLHF